MPGIEVLSRTQRIIVLPNTSVSIVKAGPEGPTGPRGLPGIQGLPGEDGVDGVSPEVFQYAPTTEYVEGDKGVLILGVDDVGNYSAVFTQDGGLKVFGVLSDEELRAAPVPVVLDEASLSALESVTVVLDAASLAALETINVENIAGTEFSEDTPHTSGAAGSLFLAVRRDSNTASVDSDGDYTALHTDSEGKLKVTGGLNPATVGSHSDVANAVADGQVLAANASRKHVSIFNDDTYGTGATAHIALGFAASATAFTAKIPPQGLYEVPESMVALEIRRYSTAATGTLRVTAGT